MTSIGELYVLITPVDDPPVVVQRKDPMNRMEKPCRVTWLDLISIASLQTFGVVLDWGCEKTRVALAPGAGQIVTGWFRMSC